MLGEHVLSVASEAPSTSSLVGTPSAFSCVIPKAPASSTTVQTIHTTRACRATNRAWRGHSPFTGCSRSSGTVWSGSFGMNGQKAARPHSAMRAGRNVSADSIENAMPIDAMGPRARLVARSDSRRHSRPAITVAPEARIGSNDPRHAAIAASHRCRPSAIASRNRATYSSA